MDVDLSVLKFSGSLVNALIFWEVLKLKERYQFFCLMALISVINSHPLFSSSPLLRYFNWGKPEEVGME